MLFEAPVGWKVKSVLFRLDLKAGKVIGSIMAIDKSRAATREQFRFRGEAEIVSVGDERSELWRAQTDATRALFVWPTPGVPRDPDPGAFPNAVPSSEPPPESFEVIVVTPQTVEHLDLNPHPHRRRRWRDDTGWTTEELNP